MQFDIQYNMSVILYDIKKKKKKAYYLMID